MADDPTPPVPSHFRGRRRIWGAVFETGLTLITLGVVVLLFAAYQLWGTGVAEAHSQHRLAHDFAASQTTLPSPVTTSTTAATTIASDPSSTTTTTADPGLPLPAAGAAIQEGQVVGKIEIPRIGVSQYFVQGVGDNDLREGPGHYPGTPYPGEAGNAAIAGHRTTYGAPFFDLNQLSPGDPIVTTTRAGRFVYLVDKVLVVRPTQTEILNATPDNRLTLTTCNPRYSATQRLIVVASLQNKVVAPPAQQVVPPAAKGGAGGEQVTLQTLSPAQGPGPHRPTTPTTAAARTPSPALSGTTDAWPPAILWGALFLVLWAGTRIGFRKLRRWGPHWVFLAAGIPLCLLVLWPLFENVARLLPANI